jgi:hypothetical protein
MVLHLQPTAPLTERDIEIKIDHSTETITIAGITYAFGLFRHLGIGPVGDRHFFQIVARADGVVTIRHWERDDLARELGGAERGRAAAPADPAKLTPHSLGHIVGRDNGIAVAIRALHKEDD